MPHDEHRSGHLVEGGADAVDDRFEARFERGAAAANSSPPESVTVLRGPSSSTASEPSASRSASSCFRVTGGGNAGTDGASAAKSCTPTCDSAANVGSAARLSWNRK